jgi:enoyl-CoA hydratase
VVKDGEARPAAEELARVIAGFPALSLLADRRSVLRQWGQPLDEALRQEFADGLDALRREGIAGARRFAAGKGRHGEFSEG